jgi:hypothetical protein
VLTSWIRASEADQLTRPIIDEGSCDMNERTAKEVVEEMHRRQQAGDPTVLDDLVAEDLVNHAAGPQGRDGLKRILRIIDDDLGPLSVQQHHLIGDGTW